MAGISIQACGSSPRLRGTRLCVRFLTLNKRFIPAPAGNTWAVYYEVAAYTVHPRACGEHNKVICLRKNKGGSSPRLRGTHLSLLIVVSSRRFIPAPAGNTVKSFNTPAWRFGSSPRLRGTPNRFICSASKRRFIPAPAGNTSVAVVALAYGAVHPRACGEHAENKSAPEG